MSLFKRPLFAVGVSGFGALVLAAVAPTFAVTLLCVLCAAVGLCGLFLRKTRKIAVCALFAAVALGSFLLSEATVARPLLSFDEETAEVHGIVTENGGVSRGVLSTTVKVTGGDLPADTKLFLRVPFEDLPPTYGDEVFFTAVLSAETSDDGALFDSTKANRVFLSGWVEDAEDFRLVRREERSVAKSLFSARETAADRLLSEMTQDVRPLLRAMCLGDKSDLSNDVTMHFRRSGVSHLLVVSGLHMSIVAMGVYGFLRKCRAGRRGASIAALTALWLFAMLVGFHPSVVRACVLNTMVLSGNLFRRRADGLNSLGGGLLLLWLVNPFCVYDVGLWLSFGATYGLLRMLPAMMRACNAFFKAHNTGVFERPLRFAAESLCVTLAATLPILPICAIVFGEISLIAPLTNLLAVFPATLLLWSAAAGLLLSFCGLGFFAGAFRLTATLFGRYLLWVTALCGGLPDATWSTDEPYRVVWLAAALILCVALGKRRGIKAAGIGAVASLSVIVVLCTVAARLSAGEARLVVKHSYGDVAVVLIKDDRACVIVDGGNAWLAAKSVLEKENLSQAEWVLVTEEYRDVTRKWQQFDDAIEVLEYRLLRREEIARQSFSQSGVPVTVMKKPLSLFDNGTLEAAPGALLLCFEKDSVVLCQKEEATPFWPSSFHEAERWVYWSDTEDRTLVIK